MKKEFKVEMTFIPVIKENKLAAAQALEAIDAFCTIFNSTMYDIARASIKHFEEHNCENTGCSVALDYAKTFGSLSIVQHSLHEVLTGSILESGQMVGEYFSHKEASRQTDAEMAKVYETIREKMLNKKGSES